MKIIVLFLFFLLPGLLSFAQKTKKLSVEEALRPKPPTKTVNIIYYKFYHGVQMVELDYYSPYSQNLAYREQAFPRALSWSMLLSPPHPNVYIFRDTAGKTIAAYNLYGIDVAKLQLISPKKLNKGQMMVHNGEQFFGSGEMSRYHGMFSGLGSDKPFDVYIIASGGTVQTMKGELPLKEAKYGLIDTMGRVILKPLYDAIEVFQNKSTIVRLGEKVGLISHTGEELLPCIFDNGGILEGVAILYTGKKISLYDMSGKKINREEYDGEIHFYKGTSRVHVPGKGYGIIDTSGKEICPPMYEIVEELSQEHADGMRYYYVRHEGKEFYIRQDGKVKNK